MSGGLDHGVLNVPLAKRGNIDAHLDRYKAEQAKARRDQDRERFHNARAMKARVIELLDRLTDERVLDLAKPLKARKPSTARKALATAATANLTRWLRALEEEASCRPTEQSGVAT